jgi:hypothetical protein
MRYVDNQGLSLGKAEITALVAIGCEVRVLVKETTLYAWADGGSDCICCKSTASSKDQGKSKDHVEWEVSAEWLDTIRKTMGGDDVATIATTKGMPTRVVVRSHQNEVVAELGITEGAISLQTSCDGMPEAALRRVTYREEPRPRVAIPPTAPKLMTALLKASMGAVVEIVVPDTEADAVAFCSGDWTLLVGQVPEDV